MAETLLIVALGVIVLAAVGYPVIAGRPRFEDEATLDAEVARYRQALAAGTVCPRCRFPNREGSRYCAECGRDLTAAD
ncbi:MAG TPA: zinc ribbon domain-containing protein [Longimicrobiales bacterium]|nr:zinc ribbon domain-containing protein [Longimicrobiales bacterium]